MKEDALEELEKLSKKIRYECFKMMAEAKTGHVGGSLSLIEILTVLYFKFLNITPQNQFHEDRDRFILSKAHGSPALYTILVEKGFYPKDWLSGFNLNDGALTRHADARKVCGVEASCGALGQGMSIAVGMALAAKVKEQNYKTYCVVGDGECHEGQIHEAGLFAASQKLDNIIVIVDNNKMTLDDRMSAIMPDMDLVKMWQGLGWIVHQCDGHSVEDLSQKIEIAQRTQRRIKAPIVIIANTVKGKGVVWTENNPLWHSWHGSPSRKEIKEALLQLKKGW